MSRLDTDSEHTHDDLTDAAEAAWIATLEGDSLTFAREVAVARESRHPDWVLRQYWGRNFYRGPAVTVHRDDLLAVVRATSVELAWDQLGRDHLVVHPRCP